MQRDIPQGIAPLLEAYSTAIEQQLPGLTAGLYLHGSIALGAFNERSSDIDAIAVISRCCTASDVEVLKNIHQAIQKHYPRPFLEVIYLQASDLGQPKDKIEPHPYAHDGDFYPSGHFELNSITWWLLKNRGITLLGTPATELAFSVDWDRLIANMRINLNSYWRSYTRNPQRIAMLLSDFGVQWAVLGVLRQYYSFMEHGITSKDGAGLYALEHVPERWHRLIREALNIRSRTRQSLYGSPIVRAFDIYRFLKYIIRESNKLTPQ